MKDKQRKTVKNQTMPKKLGKKAYPKIRKESNIEALFRLFFENNPDYCYIVSPGGLIADINKAALEFLGYKKSEIVGQSINKIYTPEYLAKMKKLFVKWKKKGSLKNEEMQIQNKKGEIKTVLLSANNIMDKKNNIIISVSVQRDITLRKKIKEELEKEKNIFSNIIEYNPYSIMISDKNGNILQVNKAFLELFKAYPPSDYTVFTDPNIKSHKLEKFFEELKKGKKIDLPNVWFNPKRDISPNLPDVDVYIATVIFPLKNAKGEIQNFITIHNDLTKQRRAEEALENKIKELEKLNNLMIGRELKMMELKNKIRKLKKLNNN